MTRVLSLLVEGLLDEGVGRRILESCGLTPGVVYGRKGSSYIKTKVTGFNRASKGTPILVLVDFMDTGLPCPPAVVANWCPHRKPTTLFRVVCREIESWLLADRKNLATFLRVPPKRLPADPESLADPKAALIDIARRSRSSELRSMLVPTPSGTSTVGPGYTSEMLRFARFEWDLQSARKAAESLDRCIRSVENFAQPGN